MKRGPINSAGKPWAGETWSCAVCADTGPDRDDVALSGCKAHPSRMAWAPHEHAFHPPAHAVAVAARNA
jgi:hypothetical protein